MTVTASLALTVDLGPAGTVRVDAECTSYEQMLEVLRVLEPITSTAETTERSDRARCGDIGPRVHGGQQLFCTLRVGHPGWHHDETNPGWPAGAAWSDPNLEPQSAEVDGLSDSALGTEPPAVGSDQVPEPQVETAPSLQCLEPGCDHPGGFASPQALGAHRRYKHGPGYRAQASATREAAFLPDPEPEPELPPDAPATPPAATSNGPAVVLCGCGHAERMHERDPMLGRGACHRGACGCSEYRPAA